MLASTAAMVRPRPSTIVEYNPCAAPFAGLVEEGIIGSWVRGLGSGVGNPFARFAEGFSPSESGSDAFPSAASSSQTIPNQSGASEVWRLDASSPRVVLGNGPFAPDRGKGTRIYFPSSAIPAASNPRAQINVSRPQSKNQGYPAITVLPSPRRTTKAPP